MPGRRRPAPSRTCTSSACPTDAAMFGLFLRRNLTGAPRPGRRIRLGAVELVVREAADGEIVSVAIELEPDERSLHRLDPALVWLRALLWEPLRERGISAVRSRPLALVAAGCRLRLNAPAGMVNRMLTAVIEH